MSNVYAFIFAGLVGAGVALYVWLNSSPPQAQRQRSNRPKPPDSPRETGDVSPPRYFEKGTSCIICYDEHPNFVEFMPCRHSCMCGNCCEVYLRYATTCPLCRGEIDSHRIV